MVLHLQFYHLFLHANARMVACAPGPGERGPFPPGARTLMCSPTIPFSFTSSAARVAASIAANGDDSCLSARTTLPPDQWLMVSAPVTSVMVMMVLLKDEYTLATPHFSLIFSAMISPYLLFLLPFPLYESLFGFSFLGFSFLGFSGIFSFITGEPG